MRPDRRVAAALAFTICAIYLFAQPSTSIRNIFVDNIQAKGPGANQLRQRVVDRLRQSSNFHLVDNASDADATVHGTGEIWVQGHVAYNPHGSTRETVYNGYLSLAVKSKNGETLWSYLVTPHRMYSDAAQEMADDVVRRMVAALTRQGAPATQTTAAAGPEVTLNGAGSTFSAPLYQEWIESFEAQHPQIRTTYQAVGSEEGIDLLKAGKVDFAGSDVPLSDEQMAGMSVKFDHFATVLGGVVPAYNLSAVGSGLRFTPEILAEVYMGKIQRWNDAKLRAINRWSSLPDAPIIVVHRSDGSGTTFAWTSFLSATDAEWKASVGSGMRVSWPVGQAAQGNDAVAEKVAETPGAIGYVELTYAVRHELNFGLVRNAAGKFVQANLTTLSAAAKAAPKSGDNRVSLVNPAGSDSYPITTFTWILLPQSSKNPQKTAALKDLLRWMLTSGQKESSGLGYLPLPKEIAEEELRRVVLDKEANSVHP